MLRATTACTFSSLIWPAGSAPAALASLLFDPPDPPSHWKNTVNRDFPTFSRICIFFLLILSLLTLLTSAFQLSILSEVSLLNFLRQDLSKRSLHKISLRDIEARSLQEVSRQDLCASSLCRRSLCKIFLGYLYTRSLEEISKQDLCGKSHYKISARSRCRRSRKKTLQQIFAQGLFKRSLCKVSL